MVGGHSRVIYARRGPLLYTLAVSLCLLHVSGGGPVVQVKIDWLLPWNVTCKTCGHSDPTFILHCRQTPPMYPFRIHCKLRFTPKVNVFAVHFIAVAKLDGTYVASNHDGPENQACPDIGVGRCPWFANETYSGEIDRVWGGNLWSTPKGHYELKTFAENQDGVMFTCITCQGDVKHYLNSIVNN